MSEFKPVLLESINKSKKIDIPRIIVWIGEDRAIVDTTEVNGKNTMEIYEIWRR